MSVFSKIMAALFFLILTFLALTPLGAGFGDGTGAILALGGAALVVAIVLFAPSGRRAWGRGFLLNGAIFVAMPLLVLPLLGSAYSETVGSVATNASDVEQAAASIGAGAGVALAFGAFSFVGIIVGVIFLVFGAILALGGRREVVIVEKQ
jgi:hypothetical protein